MAPTSPPLRSARAELLEAAEPLGPDELRVLVVIARRLAAGRRQYGPLDVENDERDFRHEALEEAADMAVYAACGLLRGR